jgi:hypothetical protein
MPKYNKYSKEMEDELAAAYQHADNQEERDETVETFALKWGKPKRSIIAKLSKMQIYKAKERISNITGGAPRTKEQIVKDIAILMRVPLTDLSGLEKSPKLPLQKIKDYILILNKQD